MNGRQFLAAWSLACALAGCQRLEEKPVTVPPRVEKDSVVFESSSPQVASLQTAEVQPRGASVLKFNGRIVWDEDRTVRVFSPFAGRVTSIAARPGDRVTAGQALAVLASPELGMVQADARRGDQDYALAQKNLARIEELHGAGVAPAKDLHAAQAELARAASERTRTQAKLKLYGNLRDADQMFALRSPIAGVVVERNLNAGQEVRPDGSSEKPLFVVSDPSRLWFLLDVAEKDLASIRRGIPVKLAAASLEGQAHAGRVEQIADIVDPQTRSIKIRGSVDNTDRQLKAEMFVTGTVEVPATTGLLVPTRAVYLRGEQYFAFVHAGSGRYVRKRIRVGPTMNGSQVVTEGLQPGDSVVVDGNLLLEKILASKD